MKKNPTVKNLCKICNKARAKRACPGVEGDICATCCGTGREVIIDCPRTCPFLREARKHDEPAQLTAEQVPNYDISVSEEFVRKQEHFVLWLGNSLTRAMEAGKAVDSDAREAMEALIKTYRTLESGLVYEPRPANPYAAGLQEALKSAIEEWRSRMAESLGMTTVRDADILGVLVFIQRLELQHANGRRRGRAFLDFLAEHFPEGPAEVTTE